MPDGPYRPADGSIHVQTDEKASGSPMGGSGLRECTPEAILIYIYIYIYICNYLYIEGDMWLLVVGEDAGECDVEGESVL